MPLTPAQTTLHWRQWGAVVRANDWRMVKGRLVTEAERQRSIFHKLVWREAARAAQQESRAIAADDLRHGSYAAATTQVPGWPKSAMPVRSMADLGNRTFSRVLVLWALLIDDEDLGALIKWEHPENSEREGLVKTITRRAPDAVTRAIAAERFGTRQWENLEDLGELRWLLRAVADRAAKFHQPF